MYPWVISWLQHYSCLGCIHLINTERTIVSNCIASSLLSYSFCHKECLVWLLRPKPKLINAKMIKNWTYIPLILLVGDWLYAPLKFEILFSSASVSPKGLFVIACLSIPFYLKLDIISANLAWAVDSVLFFWILFIYSKYFLVAGFNFVPKPSWVYKGLASDFET